MNGNSVTHVARISSSPEIKDNSIKILDQLEKQGFAITNNAVTFRFFARRVLDLRRAKKLYITIGSPIEASMGLKHFIQLNPDYRFERVGDFGFRLIYRYG